MNELKWNTIYSIIMKESLLLIHKAIFEDKLRSITEFFTFSVNNTSNVRSCGNPINKNIPKSKCMYKTIFYNGLHLYNKLDDNIKYKKPKLFFKIPKKKYIIFIS